MLQICEVQTDRDNASLAPDMVYIPVAELETGDRQRVDTTFSAWLKESGKPGVTYQVIEIRTGRKSIKTREVRDVIDAEET